mmetsp:Transcript_24722/g.77002  ORF Transcript_24722/g.77002 Transcript_24722/m.77002 type:complete len:253 (+) Transcript_24722:1187-1945(+)
MASRLGREAIVGFWACSIMSMTWPGCPSWLLIFERLSVPVITAPNHSSTACLGASPPRRSALTTPRASSCMATSCCRSWLMEAFSAGRVFRWRLAKCTAFALCCARLGFTWLSCGLGASRKPSRDSVCSRNPSPACAGPGTGPLGRKTGSRASRGTRGEPLPARARRLQRAPTSLAFVSCRSRPAMASAMRVSTGAMAPAKSSPSSSARCSDSLASSGTPSWPASTALATAMPTSPSFMAPNISGHCTASAA